MLIFTQNKIDILKINLIVFGKTALISLNGCKSLAVNYIHYFFVTSMNKILGEETKKRGKTSGYFQEGV